MRRPATNVRVDDRNTRPLTDAVRAGIRDCVTQLGGTSASFALPAWQKWAKLLTDGRNAKGWPRVFADGRGLVAALLGVWEEVSPVGASGGHLRGLYADFLDEAAPLLGPVAGEAAAAFRIAADAGHQVGGPAGRRARVSAAAGTHRGRRRRGGAGRRTPRRPPSCGSGRPTWTRSRRCSRISGC